HADVLEVDREVAHRRLVELLLHVGEDQDGLLACTGLVHELGALEQPARDVGVGAALDALEVAFHLLLEGALLRVRLRGSRIETRLGDDVLLAEAAAFHARYRQGVSGLQSPEEVVDDDLRLARLARVGARGIDQHVYGMGMAARVRAAPERDRECGQQQQYRSYALDHDRLPIGRRYALAERDLTGTAPTRPPFTKCSMSRGSMTMTS